MDRPSILILKFPYSSAFGGGEAHTLDLSAGLRRKGAEVFLGSADKILLEEFSKRGWWHKKVWGGVEPVSAKGIILFTLLSPLVFCRLCFFILAMKIKHGTNILYCLSLTEKLLLTLPARLFGYRVFWIEHLRIERWLYANPYRIFYTLYSRLVTVVAVSNAVRHQLLDLGVREKNAITIYNGVDFAKFKEVKRNNHGVVVIGAAARLEEEKGLTFLLRAFKLVHDKFPITKLVIAGIGSQEQQLRNLAHQLNLNQAVDFVGFQKDIASFFARLDIFALTPVRRESFGIVVAEAGASGLPAVVTKLSGLQEVVEDRVTGFVVPVGDVAAIADKLSLLAADVSLRQTMGEKARVRVVANFSLEQMVDKFFEIIQKNKKFL